VIVNQCLKMISKKILFFSFFSLLCFSHFSYASNREERDGADKKQAKGYVGQGVNFRDIDVEAFRQGRKNKTKGDRQFDHGYQSNSANTGKSKCCCCEIM
jgi:hypothetical protein